MLTISFAILLQFLIELVQFILVMISQQLLFDEVKVAQLLDDGAAQAREVFEVVLRLRILGFDHAKVELL